MSRTTLVATPLGEAEPLTLGRLSRLLELDIEHLIEMVEVGVVEPASGREPGEWRFDAHALIRVRRAMRLRRDLAVDLAGAAVVLDLIEEVRYLRLRVEVLETRR